MVWYSAFALVFRGKIEDILLGVTTLSFWIKGSMTWWFISAILVLYIFTPFYIDFFEKSPRKITIFTVLVLTTLGLWILTFSEKIIVIDKYHIVINIIAYLLSMIAAYLWSNTVSKFIIPIFNS